MDKSDSSKARRIAQAVRVFEQKTRGRLPSSVTVVLSEDTLVVTLRGTLSPAETALGQSSEGSAQIRELQRQLFATTSEPLCRKISRITGTEVSEATTEVDTSTGTVVQVFSLAHAVPASTWSGSDPGPEEPEKESNDGTMPEIERSGKTPKQAG